MIRIWVAVLLLARGLCDDASSLQLRVDELQAQLQRQRQAEQSQLATFEEVRELLEAAREAADADAARLKTELVACLAQGDGGGGDGGDGDGDGGAASPDAKGGVSALAAAKAAATAAAAEAAARLAEHEAASAAVLGALRDENTALQ